MLLFNVVALIPPVPIAESNPAVDIWIPFAVPRAVTCRGKAVDVPTVLTFHSGPVRVLPVVSTKLKIAVVEVPESAAAVNSQSLVKGDA